MTFEFHQMEVSLLNSPTTWIIVSNLSSAHHHEHILIVFFFLLLLDNYAIANPLPQNVLDLNYMNVAPPNQLYDNQQAYGGQQPAFGPMRFGPSYTIIGPHPPEIPPGAGVYDPNLVVPGVSGFGMGLF